MIPSKESMEEPLSPLCGSQPIFSLRKNAFDFFFVGNEVFFEALR